MPLSTLVIVIGSWLAVVVLLVIHARRPYDDGDDE